MGPNSAAHGVNTGPPTRSECPECAGRVMQGDCETVCEDCGLVVTEQQIDHAPEWGSYADEGPSSERTGAPLTEGRHDRGLSTAIGWIDNGDWDALSGAKRRQLQRLRREHTRGKWTSTADWNLAQGCSEIARIVGALGLGESIREQASALFRSAQSEGLLPGRSIEAMAAASVYAACRCAEVVRPIEAVAGVARVAEGRVQNAYDVLNVELGLPTPVQQPSDLVPWVADGCDAPCDVERRALEFAQLAEERGIANGCRPSGVAAACIRRAAEDCGWLVTQTTVADAANTTPVTVRAHEAALDEALSV